MTVNVAVGVETERSPLARWRVVELVRSVMRSHNVREALVSVTFLPTRAMAMLNRRYLGHRGPTDVIAFGFARGARPAPVMGDIYIAPEVARDNARRLGVGVREEIGRLVVHGTLHVLGQDHPTGAGRERSRMWRAQERLLTKALARTEGGR
jgi:probable rRNA maturation factor